MGADDTRGGAGGTEALRRDGDRALVRKVTLRVCGGEDAGKTFTSTSERAVIGTHESADLLLTDPSVSRFHCEIALVSGRVVLRDLGSVNGTIVDGTSVITAHVRHGAIVALGRTQLVVNLGDEEVEIPLSTRSRFGLAVGRSFAMRRAFAVLSLAAQGDATVLLEGETGTGKEVLAESLHSESARRAGPFIVVDCGAIPRDLLESELFGHERGAFTGAHTARVGAFEAASGGTLFLDEIGELGLELQPKLLRALEKREVKRVGSNRYEKVDVRVVGATHRSLRTEVNDKRFRPDLYYRLAIIEVRVPPLRERKDDLPLLVEHLLGAMRATLHPHAAMVRSPEFMADLACHSWPGNVRELRNYLERCLTLSQKAPLVSDVRDMEPSRLNASMTLQEVRAAFAQMEGKYLLELVAHHQGNVAAAARAAGVDRAHLYRMLWRHGLR